MGVLCFVRLTYLTSPTHPHTRVTLFALDPHGSMQTQAVAKIFLPVVRTICYSHHIVRLG